MKKSVRKAIRLTPEMAEAIDVARGDVSWSRWVERALESALGAGHKPDPVGTPEDVPGTVASAPTRAPNRADVFRKATGNT